MKCLRVGCGYGWSVIIGGTTTSTNLPVSEGALQGTVPRISGSSFVAKVDNGLRSREFSTYIGAPNGATRVTAVAGDRQGTCWSPEPRTRAISNDERSFHRTAGWHGIRNASDGRAAIVALRRFSGRNSGRASPLTRRRM
jgi:hypothetical protein